MTRTSLQYITDVKEYCDFILSSLAGKSYEDFTLNEILIPAMERVITIISIALNNALERDTDLTVGMKNTGRAILYGNHLLKTTYSEDPNVLWDFIHKEIPIIKSEVAKILHNKDILHCQTPTPT